MLNPVATFKRNLKIVRGELVATKDECSRYTEGQCSDTEIASYGLPVLTVAKGICTIAGILIRIIDALPGPDLTR